MENKTINIEEIMQEIRQEIKEKHLTADMLSFEDVPYTKPGDAVHGYGLDSQEVKTAMVYLNSHYNVQPYKPLAGNPVFVFIKKVIRKLAKFYIIPIVDEQNQFNENTVRMLNAICHTQQTESSSDLVHRLEVLELNQKHLHTQIELLRKENETLRAELEANH